MNVVLLISISVFVFRILQSAFKIHCTRWQAVGACSLTMLFMHTQMIFEFKECQNDLLVLPIAIFMGLLNQSLKLQKIKKFP